MGRSLEPLKHDDFRNLFLGRLFALFGGAIASIALSFAVLDLTHSASKLGYVLAARSVPLVLFVVIGGVIADKLPRGRILMASNLVGGVSQGIVALLILTHNANLLVVAGLEFVGGVAAAFLFPALGGLTPRTVPDSILQQANALLRLGSNAASVCGSALAGIFIAITSPAIGMAVSAATYITSALFFRRIASHAGTMQLQTGFLKNLKEGWSAFISHKWVVAGVTQAAIVNASVAGALGTLGPIVAQKSVGRAGWGWVLASTTIGMLFGAAIGMKLKPKRPMQFAVACIFLEVPVLIALAWKPQLWLLMPLMFIAGLGLEFFTLFWDVSLQRNISPSVLSRVSSYDALGSFAMIPIGQTVAGPLSAWIGVPRAITIFAFLVGLATIAALSLASVRNLTRPSSGFKEGFAAEGATTDI